MTALNLVKQGTVMRQNSSPWLLPTVNHISHTPPALHALSAWPSPISSSYSHASLPSRCFHEYFIVLLASGFLPQTGNVMSFWKCLSGQQGAGFHVSLEKARWELGQEQKGLILLYYQDEDLWIRAWQAEKRTDTCWSRYGCRDVAAADCVVNSI